MKLLEGMKFVGKFGFDIGDNVWDWGTYIEYDYEAKDHYQEFVNYCCEQIEMIGYRENGYSPCKVSKFIKEHIKAFEGFANKNNKEEYKTSYYEDFDYEGEEFYEVFMNTFESLLVGNYSENNYKELMNLLKRE